METADFLVFAERQNRLCKWLLTLQLFMGLQGAGSVMVKHMNSGLRETWVRIPAWSFISWVTCYIKHLTAYKMQMIKQAPADHLWSAKRASKYLTFINSLNHHNSSMKFLLSLVLFYGWGDWGTKEGHKCAQGYSADKWWSLEMASGNLAAVPWTTLSLGLLWRADGMQPIKGLALCLPHDQLSINVSFYY